VSEATNGGDATFITQPSFEDVVCPVRVEQLPKFVKSIFDLAMDDFMSVIIQRRLTKDFTNMDIEIELLLLTLKSTLKSSNSL